MRNKINKASAKFWEDLLYFQHVMQIFVFTTDMIVTFSKVYRYVYTSMFFLNLYKGKQLFVNSCLLLG